MVVVVVLGVFARVLRVSCGIRYEEEETDGGPKKNNRIFISC